MDHIYRPKPIAHKLVCVMRIKNAISTISECLTKLSELVDEICIVDNGSTDGTFEIYSEFPKIVRWHNLDMLDDPKRPPCDNIREGILCTQELDEPADRALMEWMYRKREATWALMSDADEIPEDAITRELVESWMAQNEYNAILLRHCHFWQDEQHYRTDQRWKPRHNRLMWRVTPESHMIPHRRTNPNIIYNLKGRMLPTDYVIKHFGHIDEDANRKRQSLWRSIDNESHADFTGMNYNHMTDETHLELAEWREHDENRFFGNPSLLIVMCHGLGDNLMLTPTVRALKRQRPDLEISVMGLGETDERDFRTREIWQDHLDVKRYYNASIGHHPRWWNTAQRDEDIREIMKGIEEICQLTRFDDTVIVTLQDSPDSHRIDRLAAQFGVTLPDRGMHVLVTSADRRWASAFLANIPITHGTRLASIHRFCGHPPKSWDYDACEKVCDLMGREGFTVLLWDHDLREVEYESRQVGYTHVINMRKHDDDITVGRMAAVMEICDIHVGADSLPMHVASAVGIPTLGIFSKTRPHETAPMSHRSGVLVDTLYYREMIVKAPEFYTQNKERIAVGDTTDVGLAMSAVNALLNNAPLDFIRPLFPTNCVFDENEIFFHQPHIYRRITETVALETGFQFDPHHWFGWENVSTTIPPFCVRNILNLSSIRSPFDDHLETRGVAVANTHTIVGIARKFDALMCLGQLHSIENDTAFIINAVNVLRPGGFLFITVDFHPEYIEYPDANRTLVKDRDSGHADSRIYNEAALYERIINPLKEIGVELYGDTNFKNVDLSNPMNMPIRGLYTFARMCFKKTG